MPERNLERQRNFLRLFASLPFDDQAAEHYAEIRQGLTANGQLIGANDMWIAAIARSKQLTLITHNVKEFSRINGLRIEDWETD